MPVSIAKHTDGHADVAASIAAQLKDPAVVVYFASPKHEPTALARDIAAAFPSAATIGCTSAGELVSGEMTKGAVVAMGLGRDIAASAHVALVEDIKQSLDGIDATFRAWESELGKTGLELDPERWVGLVLVDGLSGMEERVMDRLGDLTNVVFIGGSAGDDVVFDRTFVAADGKAASNAAVLVLLECPNGFDVIKTQSFHATRNFLVPSKVDKATREVLEFNGKPAAAAYADALGVEPEALPAHFMAHPLGLMIGGEPFVRSPQQLVGAAVRFYCGIDEGMKLAVLDSTSIVEDTKAALASAMARNPGAKGLLNFNCILRTLELESTGQTGAYGRVFDAIPTIGFSTYGEEYIGHINQTATMLMFK